MARLANEYLEGVRLIFRNFSGKEGRFNPEGQRNVCICLDQDRAQQMLDAGWNVKFLKPREEGDEMQPYIQVKVRYDNYPPKIVLVTSHGKTVLDQDSVGNLDFADIEYVDAVITPYSWDMSGKVGTTAYLKTMYVTIAEDPFEAKYYSATSPDSAYDAIGGCGRCDECDEHCKSYRA